MITDVRPPLSPLNKEPACSAGCVKDDSFLDAILTFVWGRCDKGPDDDKTQMEGYEIRTGVVGEYHRAKKQLHHQDMLPKAEHQQHQQKQRRRFREPCLVIDLSGLGADE